MVVVAGVVTIAAGVGIIAEGAGITLLVSLVVAVAIAILTEFNPSAWITCSIATSYF